MMKNERSFGRAAWQERALSDGGVPVKRPQRAFADKCYGEAQCLATGEETWYHVRYHSFPRIGTIEP